MIDLNAVNAQTGDSLGRAQVEAESKEKVLKSLDQAASDLRQKLGESIGSVAEIRHSAGTSHDLFPGGVAGLHPGPGRARKLDDEKAVPHLKRAIELDPNFAMAYGTLGVVYGNLAQIKQQLENLSKAFELKDRASEREKFYISAHYYSEVTREIDKALAIYEQWKQTYPRDTVPWDNLALGYARPDNRKSLWLMPAKPCGSDPKDQVRECKPRRCLPDPRPL